MINYVAMNPFDALADPTRREILALLAGGERPAGDIAGRFAVSAPAVSQHLKVLREAGLVRVEKRAQQRIYSLDPAGLEAMEAWVAETKQSWNARLDRMEDALDRENGR